MAGKPATLRINIIGDASGSVAAVNETESAFGRLGGKMTTILGAAAGAAAGAGIVKILGDSVKAASDLEQSMGGLQTVFGTSFSAMSDAAAKAADNVGLARAEYARMAAGIGGALTGVGFSTAQAATETQKLITAGANLGATFGKSTAASVDALSGALRGEFDPLQALIPSINAATVAEKAKQLGLDQSTEAAKRYATTQAVLAIAQEASAKTNSAFAREANTAAGAQERASAQFENAKATLGQSLLPIMTKVATVAASIAKGFSDLGPGVQIAIVAIGGIAAVAGPLTSIIGLMEALRLKTVATAIAQGAIKAATIAWTAVQWLLNIALSANPIGLIILAIVAVIAIIAILFIKVKPFREFMISLWDGIASGAVAAWNFVKDAVVDFVNFAISVVKTYVSFWTGVWDFVSSKVSDAIEGVKIIFRLGIDFLRGKIEDFKNGWSNIWNGIKDAVNSPIEAIKRGFDGVIEKVKSVIDWFKKIKDSIDIKWPSWLGGSSNSNSRSVNSLGAMSTFGPSASVPNLSGLNNLVPALVMPEVRVFIGDRELRDLVRVEFGDMSGNLAARIQGRLA